MTVHDPERAPWEPTVPDFRNIASGLQGEVLAAKLRLGALALAFLIPAASILSEPHDREAIIGLGASALAFVIAAMVLGLARRPAPQGWLGLFTCLFDVSAVSLCNAAFVFAANPLAATNGRVVFCCYFVALALAGLRQDVRSCCVTGAAAVLQYGGIVLWAAWHYDLRALSLAHGAYGTFRWDNQVGRLLLLAVAGAVGAVAVAQSRGSRSSLIRFLDDLPVGVLVCNAAGECELANQAAQRLLGRSVPPGTGLGELHSRVFLTGTEQPYPQEAWVVARAFAGESTVVPDFEIERNGMRVAAQAWGAPLHDHSGRASKVVVALLDRTQERRDEERLRETTAFLDSIVENIPHMIFVKDAQQLQFVRLNRAGEELIGRHRAELLGKGDYDFFPKAEADSFTRADREVLRSGQVLDIAEESIHTAEQGTRILHTKKIPLCNRQGAPRYLLGISEDITARRQREDRLRQVEEEVRSLNADLEQRVRDRTARLEQLTRTQADLQSAIERAAAEWQATFDSVESPMLLVDETGRLRRCNENAKAALGLPYADLLGRQVVELAPSEPWRSVGPIVAVAFANGRADPRQVDDPAASRNWELSASLLTATSPPLAVVLVRDVSRIIELQESLRHSATLAAVGSLIAGVAHEVRNPLFAMSANLDGLEEEIGPDNGFGEYLQNLRRGMARLERLMRDLLDYAKPTVAALEPGDFALVVDEACRSCKPLAQAKGVELRRRNVGAPLWAVMDCERLEQVFQNLIENAVHFSPPAGLVFVETRAAESPSAGTVVEAAIVDEGPGFPADALPHVFEPFFSQRRSGIGLGLAISQRIIEEHRGEIIASNRASGGAAVVVRLPTARRGNRAGGSVELEPGTQPAP